MAQKIDLSITNGWILTMDNENSELKSGTIYVHQGKILDISAAPLPQYETQKVIDAAGKVVMPGFVNTHTHAAMTIFRGFADDMALQEWLNDYVFPYEKKYVTREAVLAGTELAISEMLLSGTTTFADMYFFEKAVAALCEKTGIRAVLAEGLTDFTTPNKKTPAASMAYTEELAQHYRHSALVSIAVAPHAPYSCSAQLLKTARTLAEKYDLLYHTHVAETQWEFDSFRKKHGLTPVEYLNKTGVLYEKTLAAHSVHLTAGDISTFAARNVAVAHNPECNMKLASGAAPVPAMLRSGMRVGLGTDGVGSNNNLDILQEAHTAALLHKLTSHNAATMPAPQLVRMMTIGGAEALGLDDVTGSLEKGKAADIIIIGMEQPHLVPVYNVYSQIIYSMNSTDIETVIVNGRPMMENRQLLSISKENAIAKVRTVVERIQAAG